MSDVQDVTNQGETLEDMTADDLVVSIWPPGAEAMLRAYVQWVAGWLPGL